MITNVSNSNVSNTNVSNIDVLATDSPIFPALVDGGLNLQALLPLMQLPVELQASVAASANNEYTHVLLLGHAGTQLWRALQESLHSTPSSPHKHPLDYYSTTLVETFLHNRYPRAHNPDVQWQWLYPLVNAVTSDTHRPVNLQAFGALAGWHGDSPFRLGVNAYWGSWYAYRALLLVKGIGDDDQIFTVKHDGSEQVSVCGECIAKPCISACPAGALSERFTDYNVAACTDFRVQANSPCADQCLARSACPVGREHQYTVEQMAYHYGVSLTMIRSWQQTKQQEPSQKET